MQTTNLGFTKEQLLIVRRPDAIQQHLETLKKELLKNPNIVSVANSSSIPGKPNYSNNGMLKADDPEKNTYLLMQNWVSFEYPEVLDFELRHGRFFSRKYGTDSNAIMINETAVKVLGYKDPIGKIILQPSDKGFTKRPIIGVLKDYNIESLHKKIEPACLTIMQKNREGYLSIRLNTKNIQKTIMFIESKWGNFTSKQPFQYFFFDEDYNNLYKTEAKTGQILGLFAILGIFIACLGLLGLISYTAAIRTKEIGIRKVLGASTSSIVLLLSKEVVKLIFFSTIIAWPLAYYSTNYWKQSFVNHVGFNPFDYLIATVAALIIGWLAIIFQAMKAAGSSPVYALKYE